jgi:hypothetical protein
MNNSKLVAQIPRSLVDAPDYPPDWRWQTAELYQGMILASDYALPALADILRTEKDPYVRQLTRFRFTGRCVAAARFKYAVECVARNDATSASSLIKALLVADRTYEEIAEELGTARENIVAFAMIFFDIRRYLANETWLRRMVFAKSVGSNHTAAELQERRWLSIAVHRGWPGVEQVVLQRRAVTAEEVKEQTLQVKAILTSRALEHAHYLESSGTPPSAHDLHCLLALRQSESLQQDDDRYGGKARSAWIGGVLNTLKTKAETERDNPEYDGLREMFDSLEKAPTEAPRRLRSRFASV